MLFSPKTSKNIHPNLYKYINNILTLIFEQKYLYSASQTKKKNKKAKIFFYLNSPLFPKIGGVNFCLKNFKSKFTNIL